MSKAGEYEMKPSEAATFGKTLARSPRRVDTGPSDEFKADPPDASPLHELVRKLWEAQLSDASDEHKRLMALAATELEGLLR